MFLFLPSQITVKRCCVSVSNTKAEGVMVNLTSVFLLTNIIKLIIFSSFGKYNKWYHRLFLLILGQMKTRNIHLLQFPFTTIKVYPTLMASASE